MKWDSDEYEIRPMSYLAPLRLLVIPRLSIDWRAEMAWLRELVADADAVDAWEAEGGALAAPEVTA